MDEYPNPDEEFELIYGEELQMLDEREEEEVLLQTTGSKSRKSLDFTSPKDKSKSQSKNIHTQEPKPSTSKQADILENSFEKDFRNLEEDNISNSKKRRIEDLFGDIDDLLLEVHINKPKKKKIVDEKLVESNAIIDRILKNRQIAKEKQNPSFTLGHVKKRVSNMDHIKNNLSYNVPKYPFIGVTRPDEERIYIRMHSEQYEKEDISRITSNNSYTGLLGHQSKDLWDKANQILNQKIDEENSNNDENMGVEETDNSKLWVDLYKPRKYTELLSDESTNRTLLKWLKLWDKVVFNRRPKIKPNMHINTKYTNSKFRKKELDLTLDEHDRPQNKVALLCGPPGLGKTTLAHMVAKHAGYNVVEINASDDRNIDFFKTALENSTQMKSVLDKEGRPNCLVFDEIDGAPAASIDFLIKFIKGIATNTKKGKKQKPTILKRPIICICNDVYVPALRPLRQIAFILNFPPTSSSRLAGRLVEIARYQHIKTDLTAMTALSEKSNKDIRSCLTVLNFFKSKNKPVTLFEIEKTAVGQKDMQKGLFSVWNDIFEIKRNKKSDEDIAMNVRMKYILDTVISFGDYDRLIQGVFENYPQINGQSVAINELCPAIEWFSYTDCLNKKIKESQNYSMMPYLPYGFVVWHFTFASMTKKKLNYPNIAYEANTKQNKQIAIISELLCGMSPCIRPYCNADSLRLDTLPLFVEILVPNLRTVNASLYAAQEKSEIHTVVNIMIDYNLTYIQERNAEGIYVFNMDPNIEEVVTYEGMKVRRKNLTNTSRQLLAREIELEKMRLLEKSMHRNCLKESNKSNTNKNDQEKINKVEKKEVEKENKIANKTFVPNHLQKLKAKSLQPKEVIVRDFFGRIINKPAKPKFGETAEKSNFGDIWYQFKEGYSNAVRRKVKMRSLLKD